jgi:uncharacterized protein YfaP (DUF2135 family)
VPQNGLNAPVNMTISYAASGVSDPSLLSVLHYDSTARIYEPATILAIDTTAQTITFDSRRFSNFVLATIGVESIPSAYMTGFSPARDGFKIGNIGDVFLTPDGNCLGMSTFALWYFMTRGGGLFRHYPETNMPNGVADLVALRAQIMQLTYWNSIYSTGNYLSLQRQLPLVTQRALRAELSIFHEPVVAYVNNAERTAPHAMLFYGYDANNFYFYDPNSPGVAESVSYSATGFGSYNGGMLDNGSPFIVISWAFIGNPSFGGPDSFAQIASEGDAGFQSSSNITVTNPMQNSMVTSNQTSLQGTLNAGLNGQSKEWVLINGGPSFQAVPVSGGSFSQTIDVVGGTNADVIIAGVASYFGQLSNTLVNSATLIVRFNGPQPSIFRSTLGWNQANTDVDQYVTEPTGATSWYAGHTTGNGLNLDFDNTSGYGPENTTLSASQTAVAGNYNVRVHYFSDHGTGQATDGTVTITLYERDPTKQKTSTRPWQLNLSGAQAGSCCNSSPGSTGADWVYIALVDILNDVITLQ